MHASLALGNVYTFTHLLKSDSEAPNIGLIGVGGITDQQGAERMRKAGALVVGCATMLGIHGVKAFQILSTQSLDNYQQTIHAVFIQL
ncbi:hypothetical protein MPER_14871 [Moniliophthora perniciosa FA553]|nr:hypothetical protein MPER_14871 [Moniliophthora perniciosa FA553]